MSKVKRIYGWNPDLPDHRDHLFLAHPGVAIQTVQLSDKYKLPPIVDQGQVGSCTGNSSSSHIGFNLLNNQDTNKTAWFQPSRLMAYYDGRIPEKSTKQDAGAEIRDVIKGLATYGIAHETIWPYNTKKVTRKPSAAAYADGLKFKAVKYQRLNNANKAALIGCLLSGSPFVFGFTVYDSFESNEVAKSGIVPMPGDRESVLGGHATFGVGYDEPSDRFYGLNSWGTGWGQKGLFTIPGAYLTNTNLADDFWTIQTIL